MKKAMAIELLPAKELKKQAEVPVDFSALMQKALKYDIKKKRKTRSEYLALYYNDISKHYGSIDEIILLASTYSGEVFVSQPDCCF